MDKVQKIREEVEKLKSQLLRGACSSHLVAMETLCKEEAYNEVLVILDSMQEEHISEELKEYKSKIILEGTNFNKSWYAHPELAFKAGANWQKKQMMKDAIDGEVGYWNLRGLSVNVKLPRSVEEGDKVKVIVIKEY